MSGGREGTYGTSGGQKPLPVPNRYFRAASPRLFFLFASPLLVFILLSSSRAFSSTKPSLFRGVIVADSPLGVRVVSVEEASQAQLADLRSEDVIVRIQDAEIGSIDEFATVSQALKGRAASATVLVFRNGSPRELVVHLYSYPLLREWNVQFIPDYDIRFAQPEVGRDYWLRLGRGFERADKPSDALNAYLNGLHNVPADADTALTASRLFAAVSRERLARGELAEGIAQLRQSLSILERLFDHPLTTEQLESVRDQLRETLQTLRDAAAHKVSDTSPVRKVSDTL